MSTDVVALEGDMRVIDAIRLFRERRIRRAPILGPAGELEGLVTERDLLRALPGSVAEIANPAGREACARAVRSLSRKTILTAHPDDHIEDVARILMTEKIGGLPVVKKERVVGILTESDLFRAMLGAEQERTAERLTIQRSQSAHAAPPLRVVTRLGLELVGLVEYPGPDGREVVVLRVRGERSPELGVQLSGKGWVVLDRRRPSASKRRAG